MCSLHSPTKSQDVRRHVCDDMLEENETFEGVVGNLPPMTGIFPAHAAPTIRHGSQGDWQLRRRGLRCR